MQLLYTKEAADTAALLKIRLTASYCGIELEEKQVNSNAEIPSSIANGLGLVLGSEDGQCITQSNAILRALARLSPAAHLLGKGDSISEGQVDGWLGWTFANVDTLLAVGAAAAADIGKALMIVEAHLAKTSYLVGDAITLADLALVADLMVAQKEFPDLLKDLKSVSTWFSTVGSKNASPTCSTKTVVAAGEGLSMNGVPPAVVPKIYSRGRLRVKEIVSESTYALYLNKEVTVGGWARTLRNAGKSLTFLELNDGSTGKSLQCVLSVETTDGFETAKNAGGSGSSFLVSGTVVESPGSEQLVELKVQKVEFVGPVYGGDPEGNTIGGMLYPMSKKSHTLEHLREHAHLRARSKVHAAAMRVRNAMAFATHKFFNDNGFLYIHTPIVTCADCEGAGEQFGITTLLGTDHHRTDIKLPYYEEEEPPKDKEGNEGNSSSTASVPEGEQKMSKSQLKKLKKAQEKAAKAAAKKATQTIQPHVHVEEKVIGAVDYTKDFFGRRANLTVSGQLNVETHCCALSDVYTFGPTFRAENSHTTRHLCEFWMIEPELAFADLAKDIDLAEDYLKYCVQYALEVCAEDLEFFEGHPAGERGLRDRLRNVLESPFVRLPYTDAIDLLKKAVAEGVEFEVTPEWGIDLPSEHERYICEKIYKQPVVLTDYPKGIKAFYMKLNDDEKTVAAADVLVPKIGEIIGGSQREHRKDVLIKRCIESGLDTKHVWWYLDLRKYGTVPHAGFGLGFERLILFITGLDNIRDVIPFPRWPGNAEF